MIWIIENLQWLLPSIGLAISGLWNYITSKDKRQLQNALEAVNVRLQETEVDGAHIELNDKVNKAVDAALDRALRLHEDELTRLTSSYKSQITLLEDSIANAEKLREQAVDLASTYETLIDKLKKYNTYLKGVLDENGINYKQEDEI